MTLGSVARGMPSGEAVEEDAGDQRALGVLGDLFFDQRGEDDRLAGPSVEPASARFS